MTIQEEFKFFLENCSVSPKIFSNYNGGLNTFVNQRLKDLINGFKSIYEYTTSTEIEHFISLLENDEEFVARNNSTQSNKMYSYSIASYLRFIKAREFFLQGDKQDSATPSSISGSFQVICYGAPGTGKSHGVKAETEAWEKEGRVVRTTFHPDSDYSTFVGAYKPTTQLMQRYDMYQNPLKDKTTGLPIMEQVITYEFVPQAFLQAYVDAWRDRSQPEYLVIEEINRGNCAQIFGDLFQLLDRGDDGYSEYAIRADRDLQKFLAEAFADADIDNAKVKSGTELLLPSNLLIRATMNTSDQSLFPIDSAFKRRWDWQYIPISNAGMGWSIAVGDTRYDWWDFVERINDHIFDATNSEDKKLGYFFAKAKNKTIGTNAFVGKVVFYLWNDVFKDFGFDRDIFNDPADEVNPKLSFDKFYTQDGNVKTETVKKFMQNLGVKNTYVADHDLADDSEEDITEVANTNPHDTSLFSVNGHAGVKKTNILAEVMQLYVSDNPEMSVAEILRNWSPFNNMFGTLVFDQEGFDDKLSKSRDSRVHKRYLPVQLSNGSTIYVSNQWGIKHVQWLKDKITELGWPYTITTVE